MAEAHRVEWTGSHPSQLHSSAGLESSKPCFDSNDSLLSDAALTCSDKRLPAIPGLRQQLHQICQTSCVLHQAKGTCTPSKLLATPHSQSRPA